MIMLFYYIYGLQLNIFSANPADIVNGAPKLTIIDLNQPDTIIRQFVFPDSIAPYNSSCALLY
jgi:hypothetical protein